jgi:hypothetical protein
MIPEMIATLASGTFCLRRFLPLHKLVIPTAAARIIARMCDSCRVAFYVMDCDAVAASGARFLVVSVLPGSLVSFHQSG